MDTFDLKWPKTDATFYTDGWRCRIVWREKRGGLGGTIENIDLCKRRVADSLTGAPYLLSALQARGHGMLAAEIAALAGPDESGPAQPAAVTAPSERELVSMWVALLPGSDAWEVAASGRSSHWQACGVLDSAGLFLKAPAAKGRQLWVLKLTRAGKGPKTEYITAAHLRGICSYLCEHGGLADAAAVEAWLADCEPLAHDDLAAAATAWREVQATGPAH